MTRSAQGHVCRVSEQTRMLTIALAHGLGDGLTRLLVAK